MAEGEGENLAEGVFVTCAGVGRMWGSGFFTRRLTFFLGDIFLLPSVWRHWFICCYFVYVHIVLGKFITLLLVVGL